MAGATTRQRYLDAVVEHILAAGHTDMSLVVLAEAAETSDRMLVYYFKTREALLSESINNIRRRQRRELATALSRVRTDEAREDLQKVLESCCAENNAKNVQLFYDAAGRAFRDELPFADYLEGTVRDTIDEATQTALRLGAGSTSAQTFGTLFAAFSTALACDLQTTGDHHRVHQGVTAAAETLVAQLKSDPTPS